MPKYVSKEYKQRLGTKYKDNPESLKRATVRISSVDTDTEIETIYGKTLVTSGNYIVTDHLGNKTGITLSDIHNLYERE